MHSILDTISRRGLKHFITINISNCTINNGYATRPFTVKRGVSQGCPLSGLLFALAVEALSRAIRSCSDITGIQIGNKEVKLSQYADDTTAFCKRTADGSHFRLSRDYEVRERIPVPHDNYFQSFFSSHPAILGNNNPPFSLKLNDVTLTDQ